MILFFQGQDRGCACSDCDDACEIPNFPDEDNDFVIVPGVDGVTFIMVVVFVLGSIIFLAIVFGHSVLKNSVLQCEFFFSRIVLKYLFCLLAAGYFHDFLKKLVELQSAQSINYI